MTFDPRNILVIDFGQLGDVVMSLPALAAVRARFPQARISIAVGRAAAQVVEMSGAADVTLSVDRVGLLTGPKLRAVVRIAQLVRKVRRARFDFVIDLRSFSETNLLGYLSGAPQRLFSPRQNRSLDFLSNFRPPPPCEDLNKHWVDRYADVLAPLGIGEVSRVPRLRTRKEDDEAVERMLREHNAGRDGMLVGLFPGAGSADRRWPLPRFAEVAARLERNDGARIVLFAGPEEQKMLREARASFPASTVFFGGLTLSQLASAAARLALFVSNDTGPMHVAAAVGTPVVMILGSATLSSCIPIGEHHRVVRRQPLTQITVDEVHDVARSMLNARRSCPGIGRASPSFRLKASSTFL